MTAATAAILVADSRIWWVNSTLSSTANATQNSGVASRIGLRSVLHVTAASATEMTTASTTTGVDSRLVPKILSPVPDAAVPSSCSPPTLASSCRPDSTEVMASAWTPLSVAAPIANRGISATAHVATCRRRQMSTRANTSAPMAAVTTPSSASPAAVPNPTSTRR